MDCLRHGQRQRYRGRHAAFAERRQIPLYLHDPEYEARKDGGGDVKNVGEYSAFSIQYSEDAVFIGGSNYLVGEALQMISDK